MNYLLIGGGDKDLKREVIRIYCERLESSADFDLIRGNVIDKNCSAQDVVFRNRITERTVFINTKAWSVDFVQKVLHFRENYPANSTIIIAAETGNVPDIPTLSYQLGFKKNEDQAMQIDFEQFADASIANAYKLTDEFQKMVSVKPFNLL